MVNNKDTPVNFLRMRILCNLSNLVTQGEKMRGQGRPNMGIPKALKDQLMKKVMEVDWTGTFHQSMPTRFSCSRRIFMLCEFHFDGKWI